MQATRQTPIMSRMAILSGAWNRFAEDVGGRLLVWVLRGDEASLVEAMLVAESDARAAEVPDLFVQIRTPFGSPEEYSAAVRQEFLTQYVDSWEALPESARPPRFSESAGSLQATCAAFLTHHQQVFEHLVLVFHPSEVSDDEAFALWLGQTAKGAAPTPRLRFLVLLPRGKGEPLAASIVKAAEGYARAETPDLNVPELLETLSRQAGNLGSPGGRFRHLFVQLSSAIGAGDLAQAERLGSAALAITKAQCWPSLGVAVNFALGGGYLAAGRLPEALAEYQAAQSSAEHAAQAGETGAGGLVLRSQLAVAATQVRSGDYLSAAAMYEKSAPIAEQEADLRMQLECHRMASFCHESAGSAPLAWTAAQRALAVAQQMDPAMRSTSTLPYLGEALARLSRENLPGLTPSLLSEQLRQLLGVS